jgi:hypothetical protein
MKVRHFTTGHTPICNGSSSHGRWRMTQDARLVTCGRCKKHPKVQGLVKFWQVYLR